MAKVSVIVPVFNPGNLFYQCIDSILSQHYSDFELLLIDDGSTDGTEKVCDEYAAKDSRVRVIHKENGGMQTARNLGIQLAQGEYIHFVDNDDYVLPDCLDVLVDGIERNHADMSMASCLFIHEDNIEDSSKIQEKSKLFSRNDMMDEIQCGTNIKGAFLWISLFKTSIIKENSLYFPTPVLLNDDRVFIVKYLCYIKNNVYFTTKPVYAYRVAIGQLANAANAYSKKYASIFFGQCQVCDLVRHHGFSHKSLVWAKRHVIMSYLDKKKYYLAHLDYSTVQEIEKRLREVLTPMEIFWGLKREWLKKIARILLRKS